MGAVRKKIAEGGSQHLKRAYSKDLSSSSTDKNASLFFRILLHNKDLWQLPVAENSSSSSSSFEFIFHILPFSYSFNNEELPAWWREAWVWFVGFIKWLLLLKLWLSWVSTMFFKHQTSWQNKKDGICYQGSKNFCINRTHYRHIHSALNMY